MVRAVPAAIVFAFALSALVLYAPTSAADPPVVCIDPGHGGSDPGAVNGSLHEADINLDVSFALAARLALDGVDSTLTRTDDSQLSSRDRYTYCNNALADLYVGVHTNSVADPTIDGTLTIYFHNDDRVLANALQESMLARLALTSPDPDSFIDFGLKKDALGVILKTDMPGAVAEPLFMSNTDEAALLSETVAQCPYPANDQCRRAQIVEALFEGIAAYLAAQSETPTPTPDDGGPPSCPPGFARRGLC